jgi:hypothetical protein
MATGETMSLRLLSATKPDHVDTIVVDAFKWRSEGLSAIVSEHSHNSKAVPAGLTATVLTFGTV